MSKLKLPKDEKVLLADYEADKSQSALTPAGKKLLHQAASITSWIQI
ncbi:MAG: hypothetical protein ACJAR0_004605 [Candidatus Azotimanducaceae bacterium]|jgi:hypothetical protein